MNDKYFLCTKKVVHVENCLSLIIPKVCIVIIDIVHVTFVTNASNTPFN